MNTKTGKSLSFPLNGTEYEIKHDGYSFVVKKADSKTVIKKYPTSLNKAFEVALHEEGLKIDDKDVVSLKEYVDKYESLIEELRSFDTRVLNRELRDNPIRMEKPKLSEETIAKIKATKSTKKELEHNPPIEEEDDDL